MNLQLVDLTGVKLDEDIYQVTIPTATGPIAVYPSHEDLVTLAEPGVLAVRRNEDDRDEMLEYFAISGGVVQITHDTTRILVDEAEYSDDILEDESLAALERAKELKKNSKDQVELERAGELIDRHAVRLKVAELRRTRRNR